MSRKNIQIRFALIFVSLVVCDVAFSTEIVIDINDVFEVGQVRDIEVRIPKRGFVGAPPSTMSAAQSTDRTPKWPEDFSTRFVRIIVLEVRRVTSRHRIGFALYETDPNGRSTRFLYYCYLKVKSTGCRISSERERLKKSPDGTEPEINWINRNIKYELPFPLLLTIPPTVSADKTMKKHSWWRDGGLGVVYTESTDLKDQDMKRRVRVTLIEGEYERMKVKPEERRYYSDKDKTLSKNQASDTEKVRVLHEETQIWKKGDWLWETMERVDGRGNINMRCKQIRRTESRQ